MWTTGTASGGNSEGLGGTPAQVRKLCPPSSSPVFVFAHTRVFVTGTSDEAKGAFHLRKKPGNFGGSKSGISDW